MKKATSLLCLFLFTVTSFAQVKLPEKSVEAKTEKKVEVSPVKTSGSTVNVTNVGIYFVSSSIILEKIPEYKKMQLAIKTKYDNSEKSLNALQNEMEVKMNNYTDLSKAGNTSEKVMENLTNELQDLQAKIEALQSSLQAEYTEYQEQLMAPITEKYKLYLKLELKDLNGIAVFDLSAENVAAYDEKLDITNRILKSMGLE